MRDADGLTPKQRAFVDQFIADPNGTRAYMRAFPGSKEGTAGTEAWRLLRDPKVQRVIARAAAKIESECSMSAKDVLNEWALIATADPRELIQVRRWNCRHCNGINFGYQWKDQTEWAEAIDAAMRRHSELVKREQNPPEFKMPDASGGFGFNSRGAPREDCPECHGEGVQDVYMEDTSNLSPAAAKLYAGVKVTRDGYEIKFRDQDAALANIAKYFNMFPKEVRLANPDGTPLQPVTLDASKLTSEQLRALIAARVQPADDIDR